VSKLDARLHLYRCRIPLCCPVRPEVNVIDLIRTNGGIRGAAQFEKKAACSTYPLYAHAIPQAHICRLPGSDHQLNNDLREIATVINALSATA